MRDESKSQLPRRPRGRGRGGASRSLKTPVAAIDDARTHGRALTVGPTGWPHFETQRDLPLQPRPIVGRESLLAVARERLMSPEVRLLTLTGPPGVGKTRTAWELASSVVGEFAAGGRFVDLAPIGDPDLVIVAIARTLGLVDVDRRLVLAVVEDFLRDKPLLLILDNFEQVLEAADIVARLLAACPGVKVIATSRAPLHLGWERELPIPPLDLPDPQGGRNAEAVAASPAGRLFIQRARAIQPHFVLGDADAAAVADICARLDGLPLAIELAAARIRLFPPRALLRRLIRAQGGFESEASPLQLLADQARDAPARQQTLLSAIRWSYDLLDPDEQAIFRRLSVFVGGCSVDAAEGVCAPGMSGGLDACASLVDKNLVWREEQADGEPRLRMLETIREYGRAQLSASDEADVIRTRHAAYYIDLVERAALPLGGPRQQTWFGRLERERDNLREVERWAAAQVDADLTLRLWAGLWPFWLARDDAFESRERLERFLRLVSQDTPSRALASALHGAGVIAEKLGDYATCRELLEQSLAVARQLEDRQTLALVLDGLGRQKFIEGGYTEARTLLEESLSLVSERDDPVAVARVLSHLGFLEFLEGRPATARIIYERGLALARAAEDQHRVAEFMDNLGTASELEGDFVAATRLFQEAIAIWRELARGPWLAMALNNLGKVLVRRGELETARGHLLEALNLAHRMGNRRRVAYTLSAVAALAAAEGQADRALSLEAVAAATIAEIGASPVARNRQPFQRPRRARPPRTLPVASLDEAVAESLAWLAEPAPPQASGDGLTRREREVVALLALGLTNRQIGESLVLTEGTVENYVQRILGKLGHNKRAQIAVWAVEQGLVAPSRTD